MDEKGVSDLHLAEDVGGKEWHGRRGAPVAVAIGGAAVAAAFVEVTPDVFVADEAAEVLGAPGS